MYGLVDGMVEVRGCKWRHDMGWGKEDEKPQHWNEVKTAKIGTAIMVVECLSISTAIDFTHQSIYKSKDYSGT